MSRTKRLAPLVGLAALVFAWRAAFA